MKFVFDLDGTICFQGKPLSPNMRKAIDRLEAEGHEAIFASARPIRDLLPILPAHLHQAAMVGGNGGFVYQGGRHVASYRLDPSLSNRIVDLLITHEAEYLIDSLWNYAYNGDPKHPIRQNLDPDNRARNVRIEELEEIVKVVVLNSRNPSNLLIELEKLPVNLYKHGNEEIIDISPGTTNKWSGLQALGLQAGEYIAFGNDANDIPMFQHARRSICVGDHPELRAIASEGVHSEEMEVVGKIEELLDELRHNNEIRTVSD